MNTKEYENKLKKLYGNSLELLGTYGGVNKPVEHKCSHNHYFIVKPHTLLYNKAGCKQCKEVEAKNRYAKDLLDKFNGRIRCVEEYVGMAIPTLHECSDNHQFIAKPNTILYNGSYGCFKCYHLQKGIKSKKDHATYKKELKIIHPGIEPVESYKGASVKIKHVCNKNHTFYTLPSSLLSGYGCEECSYINRGLNQTYTHKEYTSLLKIKSNDRYTIIEEYKGVNKKALHLCSVCGNKWLVVPTSLIQGQGCPVCSRKYKKYVYNSVTFEIQGYENLALDLLKAGGYAVEDIVVGARITPIIKYRYKCKNRNHFPDIYLPKENKLIEVKGTHTFSGTSSLKWCNREFLIGMNKAKQRAAIKQGYNYNFWVFSKGRLIDLPKTWISLSSSKIVELVDRRSKAHDL